MGKYPPSNIHDAFSAFHFEKVNHGTISLTDIDRLWVRTDNGEVLCVFDLKYLGDTITRAEAVIRNYFKPFGIPYLIVEIEPRLGKGDSYTKWEYFTIYSNETENGVRMDYPSFIDWLNNLEKNLSAFKKEERPYQSLKKANAIIRALKDQLDEYVAKIIKLENLLNENL